jgi:hypothetical protein
MYYEDHLPAHFHAYYNGYEATINISRADILKGSLPPRALLLVVEWTLENQASLMEDWNLAQRHQPLKWIPPLE